MTKRTSAMSELQRERQRPEHRAKGRYAKVNPCQCCGKSAGVDYCSDIRPDVDGESFELRALVLCGKCCTKGSKLPPSEAMAFYKSGPSR